MKSKWDKYRLSPKWRPRIVRAAAVLNWLGYRLVVASRKLVRFINSHVTDSESDRLVYGLTKLHDHIDDILARQHREYPHYSYFYGKPYQSLGILGIFGERATEERFDAYGLADFINRDDTVLDIGCNCGFMALFTSYRTGCRAVGVDINPYMIEIGRAAADYLRLSDRVELAASEFQTFAPGRKFSVVFSFATHWTDDEKYRVALIDHLRRIHEILIDGGTLVFESHAADVGLKSFYDTMEVARSLFVFGAPKKVDKATRELYLMRKVSAAF